MTTTAFGAFINILTLMGSAIAFIAVMRYSNLCLDAAIAIHSYLFPVPCSLFPVP
ncbi:MAG: hypothetical protein F6K26_50055 [Moorea sp. SIO2I5]|nr:hypothetical protein [Moorena sp. SIO2I5]